MSLTGRIDGVPSEVLHEEVLAPQFELEVARLLPGYLAIEKVLLLEYLHLGLTSHADAARLAARLDAITAASVQADPTANLSDIAFAIERRVEGGSIFAAWHADRSRNDLQACAQRMAARQLVLDAAAQLIRFGQAAVSLAARTTELPMPGYTHLQAAQVISPGFYLSAVAAETLRTLRRLALTYQEIDECPLGAGAMAGQELDFDRDRMAGRLGFAGAAPHALVAVASRSWALSLSADLSGYGVVLSRFATDLMMWGSGEYGFLDLPDELSGISSAMPQKKNFPILERIRGRSAHIVAFSLDMALAQRATPYANMVEVSKEAGAHLWDLADALRSTLRLFTTVLEHARFRADRMRAACERDYLGGFTLANRLTVHGGVPWRTAQVIVGRYIVRATERGLAPAQPDGELLASLAAEQGYPVNDPQRLLTEAFDVDAALRVKGSTGSTHPDRVAELLHGQRTQLAEQARAWDARRAAIADALAGVDLELAP
ncbi:MAG: argininosuccinate lyase [Micromonosporaceae bacterium]